VGAAAAAPEVLARLAELLRDPERDVRRGVAAAVGGVGAAAATPEFLALLAELLRDPDPDVRGAAARAVGQIMAHRQRFFVRKGCGLPNGNPDRWEAKTVEELSTCLT
jgi:HEAT repeat protein